MNIKAKIISILKSIVPSLKQSSLKDFFVFSGLFILSYGLWLYSPSLGYSVGGLILMGFGLLMKE